MATNQDEPMATFASMWGNWGMLKDPAEVAADEMYMVQLAEELGFDAITAAEHHFDPEYSACPDNLQVLSCVAGLTKRVKLFPTAVILPWNDPLQVIEKLSLLDHLSGGRAIVGFGRGLARMEYEGIGIDMNESRARFDEAAEMIVRGLRTGIAEGHGQFYEQARVPVHPKPRAELADNIWSVAMSPDSAIIAADMGAGMLGFTTADETQMLPLVNSYRNRYLEKQGRAAPPIFLVDFVYCHQDADEARGAAELYAGRYYQELIRHYESGGDHFAKTKGYDAYAEGAKMLNEVGMDVATQAYVDAQAPIGSPEQIIERYRRRIDVLGPVHLGTVCMYGGMSRDIAEASTRLFATEVLPELRKLNAAARAKATVPA